MEWEDPKDLLRRLRLGREEFCQRLITTLIVGGTYPPWNTRSTPTAEGRRFLGALDDLSFGERTPPDAEVFVDELELQPRLDSEQGGAPDWAVIWPHRLWLIELKTERTSHRRTQLPFYFELGGHHFPGRSVDITYVTGPLTKPAPGTRPGQRYAHVMWDAVTPLVTEVWGNGPDPATRRQAEVLAMVTSTLDQRWVDWRDEFTAAAAPLHAPPSPLDLMALIEATSADGAQRALDWPFASLEELHALRLEARQLVVDSQRGSGVRHVMPWVWRSGVSTGQPLTRSGAETGYELRFSRYLSPVY